MTGGTAGAAAATGGRRVPRDGESRHEEDGGAPAEGKGAPGASQGGSIPALEWVAAALGGLLFLAVLVFLIWQGVGGSGDPPDVSVSVIGVSAQRVGFHVGFEARNDGSTTAMTLGVEAVLTTPQGHVERLETVLDYLPAHSARRGGFVFSADPRQGRLEIRAVSYQEP